jgi:hypothetical protein
MDRREGIFNVHNDNLWARDNPHATRELGYQVRFRVSVWAGIAGNIFVGLYLLPVRLPKGITLFWKLFCGGSLKLCLKL